MSSKTFGILGVLAAAFLAATCIVAALVGGCDTMVDCGDTQMPMKCHWTFQAMMFVALAATICACVGARAKAAEARRCVSVCVILLCAVCAVLPTSVAIGICGMSGMHCHTTAYVCWTCVAVAALIEIVLFVKADPALAQKPKMQL
jgi:hypothetical protein